MLKLRLLQAEKYLEKEIVQHAIDPCLLLLRQLLATLSRAVPGDPEHAEPVHFVQMWVVPDTPGIVPGYETARHLGARAIFVERENGKFALRRGFEIGPKDRVLVIEDIITTGLSLRETVDALREHPCELVGGACLIDRSGGKADLGGLPRVALASLVIPDYAVDELPPELAALPAIKPGSRGLAA
jgi:orotate phosphoribosyltransferase